MKEFLAFFSLLYLQEYSVTFSSYFNVLWQEPRLHISERFLRELNATSPDTMIPVNLELVNELWLPNIFIYNLKTFKVWILGGLFSLFLFISADPQQCSGGGAAGRALRSQCKQIIFFKIYRQVKTKYIWNLPSCNLSGGRGAIKARRLMDHHQQRCFLLSSHSHYFYLSYEIWLISPRHSGNSFELLKSGSTCLDVVPTLVCNCFMSWDWLAFSSYQSFNEWPRRPLPKQYYYNSAVSQK